MDSQYDIDVLLMKMQVSLEWLCKKADLVLALIKTLETLDEKQKKIILDSAFSESELCAIFSLFDAISNNS
jgi:hypothetical protein